MDDNRARAIIARRLQPGEKLIWHDRPSPWRASAGHFPHLAFMVVWTGLVFSMAGMFWREPPSVKASAPPFPVVLALFCAVGVAGCLWQVRKIANCWRTVYGVTDRRAIIAVGENGPTQSFGASALGRLERKGGAGRGSLIFDDGHSSWARTSWVPASGFYGIREPARVEAAIYEHLLPAPPRDEPDKRPLN